MLDGVCEGVCDEVGVAVSVCVGEREGVVVWDALIVVDAVLVGD